MQTRGPFVNGPQPDGAGGKHRAGGRSWSAAGTASRTSRQEM